MKILFVILALGLGMQASPVRASSNTNRITIQAVEWVVGKFHRMDQSIHAYNSDSAWKEMIMPATDQASPQVFQNSATSYTIFFRTLEELLRATVQLAQSKDAKIERFNLHAHGLPGGQWFPKDTAELNSDNCQDWLQVANQDDSVSYGQYYSMPSKFEIMQFWNLADHPATFACTQGSQQWAEIAARVGGVKQYFSPNAEVSFLSCLVGRGSVGQNFALGIAQTFLPEGGTGRVQAAVQFGLGDWSMDAGMGFWDYQNDAQLERDTKIYPTNKRDADVQQQGTIRVAFYGAKGLDSGLVDAQSILKFTGALPLLAPSFFGSGTLQSPFLTPSEIERRFPVSADAVAPRSIKIPGTGVRVQRLDY